MKSLISKSRVKSPWLIHFDCGSCNGCDIEVLACLTPVYDIERFGIINVGNNEILAVGTNTQTNNLWIKRINIFE